MQPMPNFVTSPFFYTDEHGWHIKDDAPEDVKKEFAKYMGQVERTRKDGLAL